MKIALLCADGLGDGLLMMILTHHLKNNGHQVSFFHSKHFLLQPLFPETSFLNYPPLADFEAFFSSYDQVILQNDHSERAWALFNLRNASKLPHLRTLFITPYRAQCRENDYVFEKNLSIAENLQQVCIKIFQIENATKDNGLVVSKKEKKEEHPRVMIHPTSKDPKRNWPKKKFIEFSFLLKKLGYEVHFCVSKEESTFWEDIPIYGIKLHITDDLAQFAKLLVNFDYFIGNDSGMGHLASNLKLPTLTISGNKKRVERWRPDWYLNKIVTTSVPIPNFKGLVFSKFDGRIRENYWQYFISVGKVLKGFKLLTKTHQKSLQDS